MDIRPKAHTWTLFNETKGASNMQEKLTGKERTALLYLAALR